MIDAVVAVFGASRPHAGDPLYAQGLRCGERLAQAGLAVATGGYGGLMEAVSRGAAEAGGRVIGVTAPDVFPDRPGANPFVAEEISVGSLALRITHLVEACDAVIALPGSLGTLTELMVGWNTAFVARFAGAEPLPIVTVGPLWRDLITRLSDLLDTDGSLVHTAVDVDEAVAVVVAKLETHTRA